MPNYRFSPITNACTFVQIFKKPTNMKTKHSVILACILAFVVISCKKDNLYEESTQEFTENASNPETRTYEDYKSLSEIGLDRIDVSKRDSKKTATNQFKSGSVQEDVQYTLNEGVDLIEQTMNFNYGNVYTGPNRTINFVDNVTIYFIWDQEAFTTRTITEFTSTLTQVVHGLLMQNAPGLTITAIDVVNSSFQTYADGVASLNTVISTYYQTTSLRNIEKTINGSNSSSVCNPFRNLPGNTEYRVAADMIESRFNYCFGNTSIIPAPVKMSNGYTRTYFRKITDSKWIRGNYRGQPATFHLPFDYPNYGFGWNGEVTGDAFSSNANWEKFYDLAEKLHDQYAPPAGTWTENYMRVDARVIKNLESPWHDYTYYWGHIAFTDKPTKGFVGTATAGVLDDN